MSSPSSLFLRRSNSLKTLFFSSLYTHSTTFTRQIQSRKASLLDILVGRIFGKSNPNLEHLIQAWAFSDSRFCIISRNMGETSTTPVIENIENGSGKYISETISNMENMGLEENGSKPEEKKFHVIFVLGGPGSGKGTQCANIVETFGFTHLSAGDLLRAEIKSGSENGNMIETMIKEGKIVPSEVTVKLLQKAMNESGNDKFLIDGFPRNEENRAAFENVTGIQPDFVLFFDCPEEEMEKRLLGRNQGRVDDNIDTIRKRFKVFIESSLPVISYYETKGKVRKVEAVKTKEEVFDSIKSYFAPL